MWIMRLQNIYSLNKMILEQFGAKDENRKTKSKTHVKVKSCITVCYYNLVHFSATESFVSYINFCALLLI
jgi:hypothetical protein